MKKIASEKNYRIFKKAQSFDWRDFDYDDQIRLDEAFRYVDRLLNLPGWHKSLDPKEALDISSIWGILADYRLK